MSWIAKFFVNTLISPITFGIFAVGWKIFVLIPYNAVLLINWIKKALGVNLLRKLLIGDTTSYENLELPYLLVLFLAISLIMTVVFVIMGIFRNNVSDKGHIKIAIKNGIIALVVIWLIPIVLFLSLNVLEIVNDSITLTLSGSKKGSSEINDIFRQLKPSYINDREWNNFANSDFSDLNIIYKSYLDFQWGQGTLFNLQMFLISFAILLGSFSAVILITIRLFIVYFNVIIAPLFISISPLDDGKAFKKVLKELKDSLIMIIGFEFLLKIYFAFLLFVTKLPIGLVENSVLVDYALFIFRLVLIAGGTWGIFEVVRKLSATSPAKLGSRFLKTTKFAATAIKNPRTITESFSNYINGNESSLKEQNSIKKDIENEDFKTFDNHRNYLDLIKSKATNFKDNSRELLNHFIPRKGTKNEITNKKD